MQFTYRINPRKINKEGKTVSRQGKTKELVSVALNPLAKEIWDYYKGVLRWIIQRYIFI
jgi:hypothetical protein